MFVNQVDGNGNFKVTNVTSDNVTATTGTFTNLLTTTFTPTNVNASAVITTNIVSTTGTIDTLNTTTLTTSGLATSGSIQTGNINSSDITANNIGSTGNITTSGTIGASGNITTSNSLVMKSNNNLVPDASLMKLGDELRINSGGTGSTTGFYNGSTRHMEIDSIGNMTSVGKITAPEIETPMLHVDGVARIYNSTGKYSSLEKLNADLNIYASKNNPTAPSNVKFFSANGLVNDLKMTIHGSTDVVEVEQLQANVNIKTDELLLKDTTSVNLSRIIREQNTVSFIGDTLYNSCDYEFYTADPAHTGATYPKLKINRTSDLVEIPELQSTHITGTTIDATDVVSTNVSTLNTIAVNSTVSNLLLRNPNNHTSLIERTGHIVKFIGDTTSTGSADFEFHTSDGNQPGGNVPKLRILRNNDLVEVINLNAVDTVEAVTLLGDTVEAVTLIGDQVSATDGDFANITTGDITVIDEIDFGPSKSKIWSAGSFLFQSGETLFGKDFKFQTGNVPPEVVYFRAGQGKGVIETDAGEFVDLTAKGNLYVENSTGRQLSIEHVNDNIYFYGSKNNNSVPSNINFSTNAGASPSDIKLKINKSTNFVDVIDLNVSNELIVNGTNIETEIATKQDLLTAGTGITIVGNTISSTGGGSSLTAGDNIDITNNVVSTTADVEFTNTTTTGILTVKDSTNVHDLMEYWNSAQSQFIKRSLHNDDYDMFDMLFFNNDATPANRSIDVDCDMTVTGDLVLNGTNIETEIATKQDILTAGTNMNITNNDIHTSPFVSFSTVSVNGLDVETELNSKQPLLTAGSGITIDANNEISYSGASPVTYTEGLNISINAQDEIETVIDPVFDQVDAGSTSIGGIGGVASFHHTSLPGFVDHALTQYSTGVTLLNAGTGQQLKIRQGQVDKAKLDNAGDFHIMRQGTLSNLPTELDGIQGDLVTKQTQLTAGANIALDSFGNISSTDTTYTAGTNVAIDANNVISSTDTTYTAGTGIAITGNVVSADSPLARISYYRLGGFTTIPNGTIRDYFQNAFTTSHNNLSIPFTAQSSSNASSGWFLVEGTYKFEYKCCFDNGSYNDRLGTRARFYFNAAYNLSADAHGYARASSFIDRQTVNSNFIYSIPAGGQYMRIFHNCARNSVSYNDVWDNNAQIYGMTLIITKLD